MHLTLVLVTCYLFFVPSTSHGEGVEQGADPPCDVRQVTVPLAINNGTEVLYFINDFPGSLSVLHDVPQGGVPSAVLEIKGDSVQTVHVHWRMERRESGALQLHVYRGGSDGPGTNLTGEATVVQPSAAATNNNTIVVTVVILVAVFILSSIFAFIYLQEKRRTWHKKRGDVSSNINKTGPYGASSFNSVRDSHRRRLLRRKSDLYNGVPVRETGRNDTDSETECSPPESDSDDNGEGDRAKSGHEIKVVFNSSSETSTLPPSILKKRPGKTPDVSIPNGSAQNSEIGRHGGTELTPVEMLPNKDGVPDNSGYISIEAEDLVNGQTTNAVDVAVDVKPHDLILPADSKNDSVPEDFEHFTRNMKTQRVTFLTSTPLSNTSCNRSLTGRKGPPLGKKMLFIAVCVCVLVCMDTLGVMCPVTVSVQLHIPRNFLAPGSRFILQRESDVVYTPWMRHAPAQVYRYVNASTRELSRDVCAERVPSEMCEHACDPDTGKCSCMAGYLADQQYTHLCVRNEWPGQNRYTSGGDIRHNMHRVGKPEQLSVHASHRCLPPVVNTADSVPSLRKNLLDALSFTDEDDFVGSFGPLYDGDGVTENGVSKTDFIEGFTGCQRCPSWLKLTSDGSGCYDHTRDVDCSDGYDGGCDHTCIRVNTSLGNYTRVSMACSCREGYRLAEDGRTCLFSPVCNGTGRADGGCNPANIPSGGRCETVEGHGTCVCNPTCCRNLQVCKSQGECELKQCVQKPAHGDPDSSLPGEHQTYPLGFRQMQYGYNERTNTITNASIFQLTYSTSYSLSPLLVPDEVDVTEAVRTGCQNYTGPVTHGLQQQENSPNVRPGQPYIKTFTPEYLRQEGRMKDHGFLFRQELSVYSEQYRVYLRHKTLTTDIKAALGRLTAASPRSDFIHVMEKYGTHYISQAVFGYRRECAVYYKSVGVAHWLWGTFTASEESQSFDAFVDSFLRDQHDVTPSERELPIGIGQVPDVEEDGNLRHDRVRMVLRSWGRCAEGGCCGAKPDTVMAEPALLFINTPTPLYELLTDKATKEVFQRAFLSYLWCNGEGEVVGDTCRCDFHPAYPGHTLVCAPPPKPSLYQPITDQPSDVTLVVAWQHVGLEIGTHVTDYQFIVREVRSEDNGFHGDDFTNHPELVLSVLDDAVFNRAASCYGRGLTHQGSLWTFSLLVACLKPDTSYRISARVLTRDGAVSPPDVLALRTECQTPHPNHEPAGVADALYNLYAGYTSPLAQDMAFRILTSLNTVGLYDVAKTYEEKYDDFLSRTQEELGLTRTLLIRASLTALSQRCKMEAKLRKVAQKVRRRYTCSFGEMDTRKGIREAILTEMERSCVKYEEKYVSYDWMKVPV
uniref:EGF-like domain-containing protein n=1 Tax=Branchiostoma floridae TaxID=7739 RepID=C3ZHZ3_BRAFL|eukprot:XP_002591837.1 hypothetical protein BRAFLDRAFT_88782 [Branchiostoma floridae]